MTEKEQEHKTEPCECCICPKCNFRFPHLENERCQDRTCPTCEIEMVLEGSEDYHLRLKNNKT